VNCTQAAMLVPAYADGELDAAQSVVVEKHLIGCAECRSAHDALLGLRAQLKAEVPYHRAPDALRQRVKDLSAPVAQTRARSPERRRWFVAGAAAGVAATALFGWIGSTAWRALEGTTLVQEAVDNHVRATLSDRLVAVASSDRHTVRPWLSARLPFSPPVQDVPVEGFPLAGARLDALEGQPVAALVYRHRNHVVDVFVRPESGRQAPSPVRTVRGFNVAYAQGLGMEWWAVSDLNPEELTGLVNRLARGE
jgi:anti-sigma factor RsiW